MTATSTTSQQQGRKGLHPALGALAVLAVIAVGGWGVWSFWKSINSFRDGAVVTTDEPPSVYRQTAWSDRMRVQAVNQLNQANYFRPRPRNQGGGFEAKGEKTRVIIQKAGANVRVTAESMDPNFVSADQRTLLAVRARAISEDAVARHIELTEDQKTKLNAIPRGMNYTLDDATRQKIQALFTAWEAAADDQKAAASEALIQAAVQVDATLTQPTKDSIAARAEQVKQVLSAEQIKKFTEMGRGR